MLSRASAMILGSLALMPLPMACLGAVCGAVASNSAPVVSIDTTATDTLGLRGILKEAFRITASEPEQALHLSEVVVRKARALGDGRLEGAALHQRASALEIMGRYDEAALDGQRSVELFHAAQDKLGEARSLRALASVRRWQGRYAEAIGLLKTGLALCQASGSKSDEADHELGIGLIYYDEKLYAEALAYTLRAAAIFEALKDTASTSAAYANIGLSHYELAHYDKALEFHERSLALSKLQGDLEGMASSLNNIAIVQRKQGRTKEAMATQLQALAICDSLGSTWGSALCHKNMGLLHLDEGNARLAVQECERALKDFQRIGALAMEAMACQCLYDAYKRMNDPARALGLLERIVLIKDSLKLDDARSQLDHMEFEKELLADSLAHETEKHRMEVAAQAQVTHERERKNMFLFIGAVVVLVAGGLWMRLRFVHRSRAAIRKERDRSDELLLNILPAEVAEELKDTGAAAAKHFDNATILFTDFKGFTQASERMSPQELVEELNTCFKAFDGIITARGIEKIKTIGDAYMCAGGLPDPKSSSPGDVVHAALEMQAFMKRRKNERDAEDKPAFEMRVGIHTGPVVAGIVGVKKFAYDIWGDTVNIASRMESSGEVGEVNISEATYALVKSESALTFTPRGKVQAKGKGEMGMYFVARA